MTILNFISLIVMTFTALIVVLLLVSLIFKGFWEAVTPVVTFMMSVIVFFIFLGTVA